MGVFQPPTNAIVCSWDMRSLGYGRCDEDSPAHFAARRAPHLAVAGSLRTAQGNLGRQTESSRRLAKRQPGVFLAQGVTQRYAETRTQCTENN